jgi:hypothetical protein
MWFGTSGEGAEDVDVVIGLSRLVYRDSRLVAERPGLRPGRWAVFRFVGGRSRFVPIVAPGKPAGLTSILSTMPGRTGWCPRVQKTYEVHFSGWPEPRRSLGHEALTPAAVPRREGTTLPVAERKPKAKTVRAQRLARHTVRPDRPIEVREWIDAVSVARSPIDHGLAWAIRNLS